MWKYFILGLLVGWLIEWLIDWFYWRRTSPVDAGAATNAVAFAAAGAAHDDIARQAAPEFAPQSTPQSALPTSGMAGDPDGAGAVEPNARTTTSADTPAGRVGGDAAVGAPGAVSTSSATLTTKAPVYRQEDLEAIAGVGPKIGAMLRNNGITTFAELAATPLAELVRIVESTGESPEFVGLQSWAEQATLAAAQDWAALAALNQDRPLESTRGEA